MPLALVANEDAVDSLKYAIQIKFGADRRLQELYLTSQESTKESSGDESQQSPQDGSELKKCDPRLCKECSVLLCVARAEADHNKNLTHNLQNTNVYVFLTHN